MAQIRCQFSRQKNYLTVFLNLLFFFFFATKKVNPLSLPYYFRFVFSSNCLFMPQPISRKTGLLGISLLFGKTLSMLKVLNLFFPIIFVVNIFLRGGIYLLNVYCTFWSKEFQICIY